MDKEVKKVMSKDFIIQIKVQLAKHGKTQNWLADTVGISRPYMSDIMRGARKPDKQIEPITLVLRKLESGFYDEGE